jgi:hypothetical protein
MATYITEELPQAIEAAGLPIVCVVMPRPSSTLLSLYKGLATPINFWS